MKKTLKLNRMGNPRIDLVDCRYGRLTVIAYAGSQDYLTYWKCICDCGQTKTIRGNHLKSGNTKSCGCQMNKTGSDHPRWKGYGEISRSFILNIQKNASVRNMEYSLSDQYIWDLFLLQNRKCALSMVEIKFSESWPNGETTASLDRINQSTGYIEGNVQWLHKNVNLMKNALDQEYFIEVCQLIASNNT